MRSGHEALLPLSAGALVDRPIAHEPDLRHGEARRGRAGLVGEIVVRIERKGLRVVAAELRLVDKELAERALRGARGQALLRRAASTFITRSPVFAMVVEGPADNTFSLVRGLVGATKVDDAAAGTIRGDFATITTENLVHASDGHESAGRGDRALVPRPLTGLTVANGLQRLLWCKE